MARAKREGLASARLHTRLVALFSVIAAVPTVLVAIFASLLFQSGLEFWFSDRARNMPEVKTSVEHGPQVKLPGYLAIDPRTHHAYFWSYSGARR